MSQPEFEAEGWWKAGATIYQNVHGKLVFDQNGVSMFDEAGQTSFKLNYQDIQKVSVKPGSLHFKTLERSYYVSFFDPVKTGLQVGIGSQSLLGFIWLRRGVNRMLSYSPISGQAEMTLRNHSVSLDGSSSTDGYWRKQLKGGIVVLVFLGIIFLVVVAVLAITG